MQTVAGDVVAVAVEVRVQPLRHMRLAEGGRAASGQGGGRIFHAIEVGRHLQHCLLQVVKLEVALRPPDVIATRP